MKKSIQVKSEIGTLKTVLLHRPGNELLNLTPNALEELLFDDIPYLKQAQKEHDNFADVLRGQGVEVVYLEDLMTEVLAQHPEVLEPFLKQWISEGDVHTELWQKHVYDYLCAHYRGKDLVLKTMEGISLKEIGLPSEASLVDLVSEPSDLVIPPMPNLYFARDPFAIVGNGVCLNHMRYETRRRETIYGEYIFKYHDSYANQYPQYMNRYSRFTSEGGDMLNLSANVLAIGISQRTEPDAIEEIAKQIFHDEACSIDTVLAFSIPNTRAFMHLDTVFTQVNTNQFTIHPGILDILNVYEIKKDDTRKRGICIREVKDTLEDILKQYLHLDTVELIPCGGDDLIASMREQWNDGSNTLSIAPGKIVVYDRNERTNQVLIEHGLEILEIPSAELSRGRGGPRCMSMPLVRE